jgi:hypothetical protein
MPDDRRELTIALRDEVNRRREHFKTVVSNGQERQHQRLLDWFYD